MTRALRRSLAVFACVTACLAIATASLWTPLARVHSGDLNGDGRPDSWRTYDRDGRLSHVTLDTNFDGHADLQEYYDHGALIRRERDRDFNDRIDLVQEFDPATSAPIRSVVDVDADGVADLLVLYRAGQPVVSRWAPPANRSGEPRRPQQVAAAQRGPLTALEDPFLADLSMREVLVVSGPQECVGLSTAGGAPPACELSSPHVVSSHFAQTQVLGLASLPAAPRSPRGPPLPHLLS